MKTKFFLMNLALVGGVVEARPEEFLVRRCALTVFVDPETGYATTSNL